MFDRSIPILSVGGDCADHVFYQFYHGSGAMIDDPARLHLPNYIVEDSPTISQTQSHYCMQPERLDDGFIYLFTISF